MKVEKLNLINFRGFEHLELNFEPDINVIAGVNGVGKSAVLDALAVLFSQALPDFTPSKAKARKFAKEDIYYGSEEQTQEISITFSIDKFKCDMTLLRSGSNEKKKAIPKYILHNIANEHVESETNRTLAALKKRKAQPLVILFSPKCSLHGSPRTLLKPQLFNISNAYNLSLEEREIELHEFMHWFRTQEALAQSSRTLDLLRTAISTFIPEFTELRILEDPIRFAVTKDEIPLALNQLSDGERGLLAIIFDITRRLAIANPELENPLKDGKAIILIDELELHLHPAWQRQALRRLRNIFQNCQFIITTHSPQIIGQVKPEKLIVLYKTADVNIRRLPISQSFGMDSNWVLETIMGALPRDYKISQKLSVIYDAIDEEKFKKANQLIEYLETETGIFPELQELKSMATKIELFLNYEKDQ